MRWTTWDVNLMYYETHEIWTSCTMKHMRYEPHVLWTTRRMWFIVHSWRMSYVYTALRSVTPIIVWCSIFNLHDPLMMKQYRSFCFSTDYCFLILFSIHRWVFIVDIVFQQVIWFHALTVHQGHNDQWSLLMECADMAMANNFNI